MSKKIVQDLSVLRKISEPVESVEEALSIIQDLEKTLGPIDHGVGLSAIQIGTPKQIGVIKRNNEFIHLINPEVIEQEEEFVFYKEGCLSLPGTTKNTKRYRHFTIKNHRIEDDKFEEEKLYFYYSTDSKEIGNDGLVAIAAQHEIEHFKGKLILDHDVDIQNQSIQRESSKVGRNDPCPCGKTNAKGKPVKYKKCCGK